MIFSKWRLKPFFGWALVCLAAGCVSCAPVGTEDGHGVFSLTGRITGYNPKESPSIGKVYYRDALTGEYRVEVVEIASDGRFETAFPLRNSQNLNLKYKSRVYPVYALPGGTLALTLNADDPESCRYAGDGAGVSGELAFYLAFRKTNYSGDAADARTQAGFVSPDAFKARRDTILAGRIRTIDSLLATRRFSSATAGLLYDLERLNNGNILFYFVSSRNMLRRMEPDNPVVQQPLPDDYYDFLEEMPFENKGAISLSQYNELIDDIYYSQQLLDAGNSVKDTLITVRYTLLTYLLDRQVPLTDEEREIAESHRTFLGTHRLTPEFTETFNRQLADSVYWPFEEKYAAWTDSFNVMLRQDIEAGNLPLSMQITSTGHEAETLKKRYRVCREALKGLYLQSPSRAADLWTLRFFLGNLKGISSEADAETFYEACSDSVADPAVKALMKERLQKNFARFVLPEKKGSDWVRRLIAAHPGKYVLIDFWGTTCGPCIGEIEQFSELRKSYTNSPDFAYVFVTSPEHSVEAVYRDYLSDRLKGEESHWLTVEEYAYLEDLFDMAGMPRYVLIDREGVVRDDSFDIYQLGEFLKQEKIRKSPAPEQSLQPGIGDGAVPGFRN